MEYSVRYSVFGENGLMGVKDYGFEAENDEEAVEFALKCESDYSGPKHTLLLDFIEDEDGNEIEWER